MNAADVLIVGDSISMGYWKYLQESLSETPIKIRHIGENGANSGNGVKKVRRWLVPKPDIVVFNFGLHDLAIKEGRNNIPLEQYLANLKTIIGEIEKSGATPIWVTTTPASAREAISPSDILRYNLEAEAFMKGRGIEVVDVYHSLKSRPDLLRDGTHFKKEGSEMIAECVELALRNRR